MARMQKGELGPVDMGEEEEVCRGTSEGVLGTQEGKYIDNMWREREGV